MKLDQMKAVKKEDVANRLLQQKRKWAADDEVEILSQRPSKRRKLQNEEAKEEPQESLESENKSPKSSPKQENNPVPIRKVTHESRISSKSNLSYFSQLILRFLLVTKFGACMLKSSFLCFGSKIEISIMKSVRDLPGEQLLIHNHDDLTNLDIEINFLKVCIFCCFFSSKFLNKLCIKMHEKP